MIVSQPFSTRHAGQPALLYVLRNHCYCWGRLVLADGAQLDVQGTPDHYTTDEVAATALLRTAARGRVEPSRSTHVLPAPLTYHATVHYRTAQACNTWQATVAALDWDAAHAAARASFRKARPHATRMDRLELAVAG